jgi:hypothetical protein
MLWRSVVALVVAALCPALAAQTHKVANQSQPPLAKGEQAPPAAPDADRGVAVPPNDECLDAALIYCGSTASADTLTATQLSTDPIFPCRFGIPFRGVGTVWFRYVAVGPTATFETSFTGGPRLPNGGLPDTLLAVYGGTCGNLEEFGCNDDINAGTNNLLSRIVLNNLIPGDTYYIQVAAWSDEARANYILTVSGCNAINDTCQNPLPIACGDAVNAGCSGATINAGEPGFPCRAGATCSPGSGAGQGGGAIWFSFVAPNATVVISTEATTPPGDSILALYAGECDNLELVACNDDVNCLSGGFLSRITTSNLIPGQTYLIAVAAWSPAVRSDFTLTIDCTVPNDSCANPRQLACGQPVVASLAAATNDPGDPLFGCRVSALNCSPGTSPATGAGTVWYSFTATTTRAVIETQPFGQSPFQLDTILQVFSPSSTCGTLTPIACNDDIACSSSNFLSRIELTTLVPGQTYLIELAAWNDFAQRDYTIRVDCLCPAPSTCPAGALIEPELCGEDLNSGCFQASTDTTPVSLGDVICGSAAGPTADFDVYRFTIAQRTNVAFRVQADAPMQFGMLCDTCNGNTLISGAFVLQSCDDIAGPIFLVAGSYQPAVVNLTPTACANSDYLAAVYPVPVCRGDANADGRVNFLDITTVLANFGTSYNPFPGTGFGDSDSNGDVEFLDITTTLAAFGINCIPTVRSCEPVRGGPADPSALLLSR